MFTGLIQEIGTIKSIRRTGQTARVTIAAPETAAKVSPGDSVAVSGPCLTISEIQDTLIHCDVIPETLSATRLGRLKNGEHVNLERAVGPEDVFGGHLVSGHVDTIGTVARIRARGDGGELTVSFPDQFSHLVIDKGSIAIDGVSLTVATTTPGRVSVGVIPTTWHETTIQYLKTGQAVNIEFDQAVKAVQKAKGTQTNGLTWDFLEQAGW